MPSKISQVLPIGQLSEEAAEARNKHFRCYRQDFARKISRESCNQDIFNRLLLTSDPLLSSMRTIKKGKQEHFCPKLWPCLYLRNPIYQKIRQRVTKKVKIIL